MKILGTLTLDLASEILGTGFKRFSSPTGIDGLAKEVEGGVEILAVDASIRGMGFFRNFIKHCKEEYDTIILWEVWNPDLAEALVRYGFQRVDRDIRGENVSGYEWKKGSG